MKFSSNETVIGADNVHFAEFDKTYFPDAMKKKIGNSLDQPLDRHYVEIQAKREKEAGRLHWIFGLLNLSNNPRISVQ